MNVHIDRRYLAACFAVLALETLIALALHDDLIRPYGGDSLAVVLLYTALRAFTAVRPWRALATALLCAFVVEVVQYFHGVAHLGLAGNALVSTLVGTTFDSLDLLAYGLGACAVALVEWLRGEAAWAARIAGDARYPHPQTRARQGAERTFAMQVMLDFCVVPIGVGVSVSAYVAECQRVLAASGLTYQMHPYGTVVEGEWEAVFATLRTCHERVHAMGAPRISTSLRLGTRTDRAQTMADKMESVRKVLGEP